MSKFMKDLPAFQPYPTEKEARDHFGGEKHPLPRPAHPVALALAAATIELMAAGKRLRKAKEANDEGYHGQYTAEFFYRDEEDAYNRAAEAYADAVCAAVSA